MADDDQRTEFFGSSTAQPEPPAPPPSYGYTPSRGDDLSTEQAGAIAGAPAQGIPDPDAAAAATGGPDVAAGTAGPQQLGQEKPRPTRGVIQDYLSRSAKMSQEEYDANRARIDPKHQMDDGEAHLRIIADLPDPDKKVAAMQYGADQTDKGVALARAAADAGHMDKVTALLNHAYKYVPAAQGTTFDPTDTGMVINTPSGGRYGNPTNLTSDQVYALVHSGALDFDAIQKNGLQAALQQATKKQSDSGEAGLGAPGAQGPGSTTPPFDEFGPTKQQVVGPDAEPRDANVPTPEKPGGGPLESFQEYGPTKQQIAPGYDRPTPRPTAPGSKDSGLTAEEEKPVRGISPEDYKRMSPADRAKLSKDERKYTRGEYFDQAAQGSGQGGQSPITGYDVAGKWDPYGRYAATEVGENSSAVAGAGSTKPPEGAPPNWQQQLGRGAPTQTQDRTAAFDRGAAGGSNPAPSQAQAGAQQFRQQLPSGGDNGMVRSPPPTNDRMARAPTETNDNMIRDPNSGGRTIDPTTGRLVGSRAGSAGANDTVTYQGQRMSRAQAQDLSEEAAAKNPQPRAGYGDVPWGYAVTPESGGAPVTSTITSAKTHDLSKNSSSSKPGKYGNATSSSSEAVHDRAPIYSQIAGAGNGRGGRTGLLTDDQGRTAGERTAVSAEERQTINNYYNGLHEKIKNGDQLTAQEQADYQAYQAHARELMQRHQGGDQQPAQGGIPAEAIQTLRQNPHTAAQFDQVFGPGAARRVLGQ